MPEGPAASLLVPDEKSSAVHPLGDGRPSAEGREYVWYGSTITNPATPFFVAEDFNTFLSIEPLLEPFDSNQSDSMTLLCAPKWIIIGAMTGPSSKEHQPRREWVQNIVEAAREVDVPVFMKQNLAETWGDGLIQEFPMELGGRK